MPEWCEMRAITKLDRRLALAGRILATLGSGNTSGRPLPRPDRLPRPVEARETRETPARGVPGELTDTERRQAGALMRVNHVGEVCAQALYEGQALTTPGEELRAAFRHAAAEEADHLAWTRQRLEQLGARPSLLNPLWYVGSFAIGAMAGRAGGPRSLGFMAETERQVERHLENHLKRLPINDVQSRAIVQAMKDDEARHARQARELGAHELPWPMPRLMRLASKVMTFTAARI